MAYAWCSKCRGHRQLVERVLGKTIVVRCDACRGNGKVYVTGGAKAISARRLRAPEGT